MHPREMLQFWLAAMVLAAALLLGATDARADGNAPAPATPEGRILEALRVAVAARIPGDPARVVVSEVTLPRDFQLPDGARLRVKLPPRDRLLGRLSFQVVVIAPGRGDKVWATARVDVLSDVVVATRPLGRGEILAPDDLTVASLPQSRLPAGTASDPGPLLGRQAAHRILPGRPVTDQMVEVPPVVLRGGRLTLLVRRPGLEVTAQGEAREDGAPDHVIAVTNLSSRRTVQARVVDAHTALVEY